MLRRIGAGLAVGDQGGELGRPVIELGGNPRPRCRGVVEVDVGEPLQGA